MAGVRGRAPVGSRSGTRSSASRPLDQTVRFANRSQSALRRPPHETRCCPPARISASSSAVPQCARIPRQPNRTAPLEGSAVPTETLFLPRDAAEAALAELPREPDGPHLQPRHLGRGLGAWTNGRPNPALGKTSHEMELAGLEPATSWVRSRSLRPLVSRHVHKMPAYQNVYLVTKGRWGTRGDILMHPKCTRASGGGVPGSPYRASPATWSATTDRASAMAVGASSRGASSNSSITWP
jgi:hypothetical protein